MIDSEIKAQLFSIAYRQARTSLPMGAVIAIFSCICLYAREQNIVYQFVVFLWASIMMISFLGRYELLPQMEAEKGWGFYTSLWVWGTYIAGFGWGIMGVILPEGAGVPQMILILVIATISAASGSTLAPTISLYKRYLILSFSPLLVHLAFLGRKDSLYAIMVPPFIMYAVFIYKSALAINRVLSESIKSEMQNQKLVIQLERAIEQVKIANLTKDRFLANISHELRTPLNSIIGFSEILMIRFPGSLNKDQTEYVDNVITSGRKLNRLIDDLLEFTEMDSQDFSSGIQPVNIASLIVQVIEVHRKKAHENNITLRRNCESDLRLLSVPELVAKILGHLVDNAIKFTRGGNVIVSAARLDETHLQICVEDNGIGMTQEQQQRLFQLFTQGEDGYNRKFEGVGMGLLLSSRMAIKLGGTISVESEGYGKGSRFTIDIPDMKEPAK